MIYLDTNVIVYAIENHPKYGKRCKLVLEAIASGKLEAASSVMVLVELINVLKKMNKELKKLRDVRLDVGLNISAVESLPITWLDLGLPIIERAARYDYPVNAIDYIHLATMELNQITSIVSADKDLDKAGWLERTDPLDYR
jgi:Predicted nucleic acid-binding protein, contains PIN domain